MATERSFRLPFPFRKRTVDGSTNDSICLKPNGSPINHTPDPSTSSSLSSRPPDYIYHSTSDTPLRRFYLDMRGTRIELDRDTFPILPETIMFSMFPDGTIPRVLDDDDGELNGGRDQKQYSYKMQSQTFFVDFDPGCLVYILKFYEHARETAAEMPASIPSTLPQIFDANRLPVLALKEELEYFTIFSPPNGKKAGSATEARMISPISIKRKLPFVSPSSASSSSPSSPSSPLIASIHPPVSKIYKDSTPSLRELKDECGKQLLFQRGVFEALKRNATSNATEQQLIDLLCVSGFSREAEWGYRHLEPGRTLINSLAMAVLRPENPGQTAGAQKLLLFWKKPARKVWWEGVDLRVGPDRTIPARVWCRRTWTLEVCLV
ncbi:uncharacterized protein VTP21DRAFT_10658 [Calcarisporiella thermophila]|uniref:uncharacterized protein n=1 Tax=Calcarisporiella thermophila TaxID=911321 RepID=UPI0037432EA1